MDRDTQIMHAATQAAMYERRNVILEGQETFACYLDLEGFKSAMERDLPSLYKTMRYLSADVQNYIFMAGATIDPQTREVSLRQFDKILFPYVFSDSWFIAAKDDSYESLAQLSCAAALASMVAWQNGFAVKGGIGKGQLWWNPQEQIVLGEPITKAYLLSETLEDFGIAICNDIHSPDDLALVTDPFEFRVKRKNQDGVTHIEKEMLRFAKVNRSLKLTGMFSPGRKGCDCYDMALQNYIDNESPSDRVADRFRNSQKVAHASMLDDVLEEWRAEWNAKNAL